MGSLVHAVGRVSRKISMETIMYPVLMMCLFCSRQAEVRMLMTSRASDGYHTMSGVSADPLVEPKRSIGDRVSMHIYI